MAGACSPPEAIAALLAAIRRDRAAGGRLAVAQDRLIRPPASWAARPDLVQGRSLRTANMRISATGDVTARLSERPALTLLGGSLPCPLRHEARSECGARPGAMPDPHPAPHCREPRARMPRAQAALREGAR
jgi:hypothetical protein